MEDGEGTVGQGTPNAAEEDGGWRGDGDEVPAGAGSAHEWGFEEKFGWGRIISKGKGQKEYEKENSDSVGSGAGGGHDSGAAGEGGRFFDQRGGPAVLSWRRVLASRVLLGVGARALEKRASLGSGALHPAWRV